MLTRIVQIEIHLAGIGVREFPQLQIGDDQSSKAAVEEKADYLRPSKPSSAGTTSELNRSAGASAKSRVVSLTIQLLTCAIKH